MKEFYLDDCATMKVWPGVAGRMKKFLLDEYGNPSSLHEKGEKSLEAINEVRKVMAKELNCKPGEVYFTSGGTESNNLAILGLAGAYLKKGVIVSAIEHPSVMTCVEFLSGKNYEVVKVHVDENGFIDIGTLKKEIKKKNTLLVSIMHANNIFGSIQDLRSIGELCRENKVLFHTDAVQSFGKLEINVKKMNINLLSASAHKIGGPKGVGLLYAREGVKVEPLIHGGGQEKNIRSGTENTSGIAGFGEALKIYKKKIRHAELRSVRNYFIEQLEKIGGKINGPRKENRMYNNIHVSFQGVDAENLVVFLSRQGIYISAGSACDSKKKNEDYVLRAINLGKDLRDGSVRISVPYDLRKRDVVQIVKKVKESLDLLKVS